MEISNAFFEAETVLLKKPKHPFLLPQTHRGSKLQTLAQKHSQAARVWCRIWAMVPMVASCGLRTTDTGELQLRRCEETKQLENGPLGMGNGHLPQKHTCRRECPIFPSPGCESRVCWVLLSFVSKPWHKTFPCNQFSPLSSSERVLTSCLSLLLSGHELHVFVLQSAVNLNGDMRSSGISDAVCSFGGGWGGKAVGLRGVNQSSL